MLLLQVRQIQAVLLPGQGQNQEHRLHKTADSDESLSSSYKPELIFNLEQREPNILNTIVILNILNSGNILALLHRAQALGK
jgi:hypothetical protein